MMKNRLPRGRGQQMGAGSGLLGEGPGMKRMMAGVGAGGLLGNAPPENRMLQPRSLMERPNMSGGIRKQANMGRGLMEQHRQGYSHGGRLEEPVDRGYYDEARRDFMEDTGAYTQEYQDPNIGMFDQVLDDPYENQDDGFASNYEQQGLEIYQASVGPQRGLLQDPPVRDTEHDYRHTERNFRQEERGFRNQEQVRQAGGFEGRGLLETPNEQRGLLRNPKEQRGIMGQPRDQQGRPGARNQRGLLDQPRERGFMESVNEKQSLREIPGLDMHLEQQGLLEYPRDQPRGFMDPPSIMDMPEPPRPPRPLIDARIEPRSLMDTPVEPRGLMDKAIIKQRGNRGQQRGLLDTPRDNRAQLSPKPQNSRPRTKQSELMEKADLQIKLLQQEKMREMEQMEQMNLLQQQQHALLLQQQQQHIQQQQQIQQQLQIKQQMQQAELIMNASKGQQRSPGAIPSIFDVPTRGQTSLGKRPGVSVRTSENKRARTGPADRRERRQQLQQDRKNSSSRDRLGGRQDRNNRSRGGRKLGRKSSPDRKGKDRRVSDSRDGSNKKSTPNRDRNERGDRGKDRKNDNKDKNEKHVSKEKTKTEITVTVDEKYDPAEPTEDIDIPESKEEKKAEGGSSEEKMDTEETSGNKESDVEMKEDGDQKPKEISLTVTVNKKGRSVNDADQDETKKPSREKMYKCNICSVSCYDEASFSRHMSGKKHGEMMKIVMKSTNQQTELIKSRLQAEEHLRQIENQKRSPVKLGPIGTAGPKGKALETLCKVCDKNFTGAYKDHKESPEHKAREDRSKAGCKICKVSTFSTYEGFTKHLQSVWHLKNKKKLNSEDDDEEMSELVTLDTVGFDEDATVERKEKEMETDVTFAKPLDASTPVPKPAEKTVRVETETPIKAGLLTQKPETQTPSKVEEDDIEIPDKYDPTLALGQKYVVPVSGFFCKLCHKFYNNESAAKTAHCQSEIHFEKLKKAIAAKLLKTKKKEISRSESSDSGGSQSNEMKNGNQEGEDTKMEEQSQDDTAEENDTSEISQEEGETTLDTEVKGKESDTDSVVEVKKATAKRGGVSLRGAARARRGRK